MLITCIECGEESERIDTGRSNRHSRIFVDETGRQWRGKLCPSCRYLPKETRAKTLTTRKCRKCGCFLTVKKYFHCERCTFAHLPQTDPWEGYAACGVVFTETGALLDALPEEAKEV